MAQIQFFKVNSLPGTLQPDSFYYVANGGYAESYLTDTAGNAKAIGNSAMIETIASALVTSVNNIQIVPDIAARDALTPTTTIFVLVQDASDDPTVTAGAATYIYDTVSDEWIKVAEYESMDITVTWSSISGRPSSAVVDIDDAVSKRHTHSNFTSLNKIGEDGNGFMTYNGNLIPTHWNTNSW